MTSKKKSKKNIEEEPQKFTELSERVKGYLIRAHSFQEVGTKVLPDKDYDVLNFPHLLFSAGVIMAIYGYFIIFISSGYSAYRDGLVVLIAGNIIATVGILKLLKKYWSEYFVLLLISIFLIVIMMGCWDYFIYPWAIKQKIVPPDLTTEGSFYNRVGLVILTTTTFAYTACFIWFILARFTSFLFFKIFSFGKKKRNRFFIVDPWRKTLKNKAALIKDILNRVYYPFLFLLATILTLSEEGDVYFIQVSWSNYFEAVLFMYILLCAMVILFPAFWLLDYVRYYNEERLEVISLGRRVLILVYGYAGFGTIIWFINAYADIGVLAAILELYMMTLYLIPTLILLIGSYILLTERDVYYIASKVPHGDKVVVEYKLIDSKGNVLEWWITPKKKKGGSKK
ncbi:MAG: hypothetical protein ACTSVV_08355 [Promethearchaeota archaeon]